MGISAETIEKMQCIHAVHLWKEVVRIKARENFLAGDTYNPYDDRRCGKERRVYQKQLNECALKEQRKWDRRDESWNT